MSCNNECANQMNFNMNLTKCILGTHRVCETHGVMQICIHCTPGVSSTIVRRNHFNFAMDDKIKHIYSVICKMQKGI